MVLFFFFSSRRRHTRCALVTGVQTCALPICYTEVYSMYRVLANMGQLLSKQRVVLPADAVAQTEVKNEARLPELKEARSEEHISELQSRMRISYAGFCMEKKILRVADDYYSHCFDELVSLLT